MKKEIGHEFLKRLGKNRLRPGGITGTNFLLENINFAPGKKILEVACNKGVNLIALAKENPQCSFVGIDLDETAIAEANFAKKENNLTNCEFFVGNAFRLTFDDNSFDFILNEAMLTMFSNKSKIKALNEYNRILKPGGLLLTHDIKLITNFEETRRTLSDSINLSVFPLPKDEWHTIFNETKFQTQQSINGELTLMTPKGMLKDEGLKNTIKIIRNGLKKENRKQFFKMATTFRKLSKNMNYICFVNKNIKGE